MPVRWDIKSNLMVPSFQFERLSFIFAQIMEEQLPAIFQSSAPYLAAMAGPSTGGVFMDDTNMDAALLQDSITYASITETTDMEVERPWVKPTEQDWSEKRALIEGMYPTHTLKQIRNACRFIATYVC